MANDVRTLDKLWDGHNSTFDDRNMWLVPYSPGSPTVVFVCLSEPISLSKIKFWNYSKTPDRGVADFSIFVDDSMVYQGRLRKAPERSEGDSVGEDFGQTILFTNDVDVVQNERSNVYCMDDDGDSDIKFLEGEKNLSIN